MLGCVLGLGLSKLRFNSVLVHFPFEACCSVLGLVVLHCVFAYVFLMCGLGGLSPCDLMWVGWFVLGIGFVKAAV